MKNIQSFIVNISAPKTVEQLQYHMRDYGGYVIERVIEDPYGPGSWTAPRWAKIGDIVFFMHAVSAGQYLKSIRRKITLQKDSYSPEDFVTRQTSITPVIGRNFDMLRDLLISHGNILPDYVIEAEASPLPL